jgi:hypothetical protein
MSRQHHEHPTQSVAPGADPEQSGDDRPARWVNPARAAAAECAPDLQIPTAGHRRTQPPATTLPDSQETPG